nr:hypothetical protein [Tanacetum cinerariifolium]
GTKVVIFDKEIVKKGSERWCLIICGQFIGYDMHINELRDEIGLNAVIEKGPEVATDVVPPTPTSPSPSSPRVLNTCSTLALRVEGLENDKAAQQLEIVKLKARVKKLEKINKVKSSMLRRLKKVGTSQRVESSDDVENEKDAEVEGRDADKQAEIYNIDLDHCSKV